MMLQPVPKPLTTPTAPMPGVLWSTTAPEQVLQYLILATSRQTEATMPGDIRQVFLSRTFICRVKGRILKTVHLKCLRDGARHGEGL